MGIDWANDTRDKGDHLNHYGAVKVSHYLGKILTEKYSLPDRRNDANYAFWKEDYEAYKQLCNK